MSVDKNILNIIPTLQTVRLVKHNLKKKKKGIVHLGVDNIVGTSLIKANADFIAGY